MHGKQVLHDRMLTRGEQMSRSTGLESYSRTAGITNTGLEAPSPGALNPSPEAPKADLQVARLRCIHISSVASFGDLSPGTGHPALHCLPAWLPAQEHRRDETVRGGDGNSLTCWFTRAPSCRAQQKKGTNSKHKRTFRDETQTQTHPAKVSLSVIYTMPHPILLLNYRFAGRSLEVY